MTRDEVWNRYVEAMALLGKAEAHTTEIREALAGAEADEVELHRQITEARDDLEEIARREAGGTWVSFEEWLTHRSPTPSPAEALRAVTAARLNGRLEVL